MLRDWDLAHCWFWHHSNIHGWHGYLIKWIQESRCLEQEDNFTRFSGNNCLVTICSNIYIFVLPIKFYPCTSSVSGRLWYFHALGI
jgi:hypothetical protein